MTLRTILSSLKETHLITVISHPNKLPPGPGPAKLPAAFFSSWICLFCIFQANESSNMYSFALISFHIMMFCMVHPCWNRISISFFFFFFFFLLLSNIPLLKCSIEMFSWCILDWHLWLLGYCCYEDAVQFMRGHGLYFLEVFRMSCWIIYGISGV